MRRWLALVALATSVGWACGTDATSAIAAQGTFDASESVVRDYKRSLAQAGTKLTDSAGKEVDTSELGVKNYPGASLGPEEVGLRRAELGNELHLGLKLVTPDSIDKVVKFYSAELKDAQVENFGNSGMIDGLNARGEKVGVLLERDSDGQTRITVGLIRRTP